MTPESRLLLDTLEIALSREDDFAQRFYELLFAEHPELEPLFYRSSRGALAKMFAQKLMAIVDHLDDAAWVERELGTLARAHHGYGVTPEMYSPVGSALLATLREACGDEWSPAAERAWASAYEKLAQAMSAPRAPQQQS
jgi:hemoglobin-like flavoprotein